MKQFSELSSIFSGRMQEEKKITWPLQRAAISLIFFFFFFFSVRNPGQLNFYFIAHTKRSNSDLDKATKVRELKEIIRQTFMSKGRSENREAMAVDRTRTHLPIRVLNAGHKLEALVSPSFCAREKRCL